MFCSQVLTVKLAYRLCMFQHSGLESTLDLHLIQELRCIMIKPYFLQKKKIHWTTDKVIRLAKYQRQGMRLILHFPVEVFSTHILENYWKFWYLYSVNFSSFFCFSLISHKNMMNFHLSFFLTIWFVI